jgi:16S rRNA (uracil1498-N3)-methyltransferase
METTAPWRAPRLFCPGNISPGALLSLPDQAAHHVARVLRLGPGDAVRVFNGDGTEWDAQIVSSHKADVSVRVSDRHERDLESPLRVLLAQGISSRERMELTLQKAVELGVAEIQPLETRRSVVRLREDRASRRVEHWQNLVIAACEQCGRNRIPEVRPVVPLQDYRPGGTDFKIVLSPRAEQPLSRVVKDSGAFILAGGPEAGFTAEEEAGLAAGGFVPASLGPRVLRTETAAVAALAALSALRGDS